tara:strand:- start:111 stop:308 length:198 start_codon:yes stop_codon:yes gene_type:complete
MKKLIAEYEFVKSKDYKENIWNIRAILFEHVVTTKSSMKRAENEVIHFSIDKIIENTITVVSEKS